MLRCLWVGVSGVGWMFPLLPAFRPLHPYLPHDLHVQPPSLCFLVPKCLNQLHLLTFALHFPLLVILIMLSLLPYVHRHVFVTTPVTFSGIFPAHFYLWAWRWVRYFKIPKHFQIDAQMRDIWNDDLPHHMRDSREMPWINSDWYMMYQTNLNLPIDILGTHW